MLVPILGLLILGICQITARPSTISNEIRLNNTILERGATNVKDIDKEWHLYKAKHDKKYSADEDMFRRKLYEENLAYIAKHNKNYEMGLSTYKMGTNHFSDRTHVEYKKLLGFRVPPGGSARQTKLFKLKKDPSVPDTMDWVQLGYVTNVKNQGNCGSCWAFSSTGALEGMHFRRTGYLVELSEQNLVDCTLKLGNDGCNGGWMYTAFKYVQENGGIDYEQSYPYQAVTEKKCKYNAYYSATTCAAHADIDPGSEEDLKGASATIGPISVAIDANHQSFMNYKSGVFYEPKCSNTTTDHAVLVVGYGTTSEGTDYWLVKNSWGTAWGMQGYIMMSRNKDNNCAIASYAVFPLEYYNST